jgi:hypothetical protein
MRERAERCRPIRGPDWNMFIMRGVEHADTLF